MGDDRLEASRQKALGLLALLHGEGVDDPVDSLHRPSGVQRAEHQVPGLGRRHGHGDGFRVPQLTGQNDIRVLAQRCPHAGGKARQMGAELALDHLAILARMDEFDGVLEADDVEPPRLVEVVDHRRQGGGLAGARGAGHQNHALVVIALPFHDRRQAETLQRGELSRDQAEGGSDTRILAI